MRTEATVGAVFLYIWYNKKKIYYYIIRYYDNFLCYMNFNIITIIEYEYVLQKAAE